jgi:L-amino acid N-acyltransferase
MKLSAEGERLVECTRERHGDAILEILNDAIVNTTAVFDYKPRPTSSMEGWFRTKVASNYPVIGVESAELKLLGFATYGGFRAWPAYKYTVEHSIYIAREARRRGSGGVLLGRLIEIAQERGCHVMIGGIEATNQVSIQLHEKHGFRHAGTIRECGFKFGRWLDLAFYQLTFATPQNPMDDA